MSKIRIAERMNPRPSDEELTYFQQMGIDAATIWTTIEDAHYDYLVETRQRLAAYGIELWNPCLTATSSRWIFEAMDDLVNAGLTTGIVLGWM